jgi:DNA invertase Pin-like site-specific DNA recombinase
MKTPIAMPVAKLCRAYGRVSNEEQLSKTFDSVEKQIEYMEHFVGTNQSQGWVWDRRGSPSLSHRPARHPAEAPGGERPQ